MKETKMGANHSRWDDGSLNSVYLNKNWAISGVMVRRRR